MGLKEIKKQILGHRESIRRLGVKRIGFFGSYARGEQRPDSDLDLLVDFDPEKLSFDFYMELTFYLEDLLGISVDLLTPEQISPHIMPYIKKEVRHEDL